MHNTGKKRKGQRANAITITNSLSIHIERSVRYVFQGLSFAASSHHFFSRRSMREHKFSPLPQSLMRVPVYNPHTHPHI